MKKFRDIKELYDSNEFKTKDLSYCDLSNLILSEIPSKTWIGFKFYYTDFSNTNIVFYPHSLVKNEQGNYILEYCNFTNCDLSYIKSLRDTSIKGSNFINTGLNVYLSEKHNLMNVIFSKEMESIAREQAKKGIIDINTLIINPHINFSSLEIYYIIKMNLPQKNKFIISTKYELYNEMIDKALEEDEKREGMLNKLYNKLTNSTFSIIDKINFFQGSIYNKTYNQIDFSDISYYLLSQIMFFNCKFNQITLPKDIDWNNPEKFLDGPALFFRDQIRSDHRSAYTLIPYIIIPNVNPSSWKELANIVNNRLDHTCFTKQTNLYLELGRICNANCFFCRNQFLEPCKYDIETIEDNFDFLTPYLDNVVIGGGEPTLLKGDLRNFSRNCMYSNIKYYISTNGSCSYSDLLEIANDYNYNINLSRHALEDEENNKIFGIDTIGIEDIKKISKDISKNIYREKKLTLVATCFQGGLDTVGDLERYIELSDYVNSNAILFQTLHEDLENDNKMVKQIDEEIFDEVICKLKEQGYIVGELPIYSIGDYKLIIAKSPYKDKKISFKKYITKEESEKEWNRASKRSFDLSMAPNGDVYQNWHQTSDKIMIKK